MRRVDVVVVGAGYAGLAAARRLSRAGLDVVVLEAGDRVGGRTQTERLASGGVVDLGGQWMAAAHTRFASLAEEYGAATFDAPSTGANLFLTHRARRAFTGDSLPVAPHVAAALGFALWRLDRQAASIDVERPWAAKDADRLDATTVDTWLRRNVPLKQARRILELLLGDELSVEAGSVSLLALLVATRTAGGVKAGLTAEAVARLFVDGATGPAEAIAAELNDPVQLQARVATIRHARDHLQVSGQFGTIEAHRAIVAVPPPLAARIDYDPPLSAARDQLTQRMPMGSVLKTFAVYDRPFWRDDGLSGQAINTAGAAPVTADVTRPGGPGVLCSLIPGRAAQRLADLPSNERRAAILASHVRAFGNRAAKPIDWREKFWADDEFCRGGYAAYFPPGVLTSVGDQLRRPIGRIHWAGTETATEWAGFVEGAIRSGERAADEIRAAAGDAARVT
ncbi:flavin monoamine oxidase family protein [Tenggerimyces flavus]|uniref:Flavin monoamine oxidase family protein n=1 Tax=Tenggerimyces flavus TaxID=1708749 RepID=A0ABV7YDC1_9ACTN|nr:FAD-dependent oxidoreductase [Tenggerimyces flavus]MBM7787137.1 monoamine oxidase [Tenggerimyces flavus]